MSYLDEAARLASLVDTNSMTQETAEAAFVQYIRENLVQPHPVGGQGCPGQHAGVPGGTGPAPRGPGHRTSGLPTRSGIRL